MNPTPSQPMPEPLIEVGTKIRFPRQIDQGPTEDTPAFVFADAGDLGEVTGHTGGELFPYKVKTNDWPNAFLARREDFEVYATRTPATEAVAGEFIEAPGRDSTILTGRVPLPDFEEPEYTRLKAQVDAIRANEEEKLRAEGRSEVIMIRCERHRSVPQKNQNACGNECGACIAAPTPPVEADKDAEIARLWDIAAHLGRNDLHESADFLRNLATGLPLAYADLITSREEIARLREEVEAFVKHTGAPNFKEAVDVLIRTNAGHMEQVEKQFNKIKEQVKDLITSREEIARLREELVFLAENRRVWQETSQKASSDLATARATIAERDKRIETLVGALEEMVRNGRKQGWNDNYPSSMKRADAALAHAAKGKEQA